MINGSVGTARRVGRSAVLAALVILSVGIFSRVAGQSVSQEFPTPVATTEITGVIKPRDLGDPRLTSHFYLVETGVGDLFVNVLTRNFTGDIDLFTQNGLQPLVKIVVYADLAENETGRVIYLRKPEKLLLRIQGRTPGDEAATYRIKFAGSFVASSATENRPPELPEVSATANEGNVRVNAAGTIVAAPARWAAKQALKTERVAATNEHPAVSEESGEEPSARRTADRQQPAPEKKIGVVITDESRKTEKPEATKPARTLGERRAPRPREKTETAQASRGRARSSEARPSKTVTQTEGPAPPKVDPLASIRLVVSFKDGRTIEKPMNEVLRFNVDKGQLTIISKDGVVGRYSLLDVAKITIE